MGTYGCKAGRSHSDQPYNQAMYKGRGFENNWGRSPSHSDLPDIEEKKLKTLEKQVTLSR